MQLTKQEIAMVQNMRLGEASQAEVNPKQGLRAGMMNSMEGMIQAAMRSTNPEVKEYATEVMKSINTNPNGLLDLSDDQFSKVVAAAKEAVQIDNSLMGAYEHMHNSTVTYNSETDESFAEKEAEIFKESRSSQKPEEWLDLVNPNTGGIVQKNSITGQLREYRTADESYEEARLESDIAFATYVQNGGKAEDFGTSLNGDDSLVNV
jgi:predicted outer membrane protein